MIIGIGTDIVEINRFKKACENKAFLLRCFTEDEIELINGNWSKAAGNFSVKESVSKCFGTGVAGFALKDIEVLRDSKGKPYVNLYSGALKIAESLGIKKVFVSISDTKETVVSFAVAEGEV